MAFLGMTLIHEFANIRLHFVDEERVDDSTTPSTAARGWPHSRRRHHDRAGFSEISLVTSLSTLGAMLLPSLALVLLTLLQFGVYAAFGVRRWTILLAYPATLVQSPLFAHGLARRTFVRSGWRYRWRSKFDVAVVEGAEGSCHRRGSLE